MKQSIAEVLNKLSKSKFRSSFKLNNEDKKYIKQRGMIIIEQHARDFVKQKLVPAFPLNDGKQTPMKGHPVFKAMHATGCCCRGCLEKWYHVQKGVELNPEQQEKIIHLLLAWIISQIE